MLSRLLLLATSKGQEEERAAAPISQCREGNLVPSRLNENHCQPSVLPGPCCPAPSLPAGPSLEVTPDSSYSPSPQMDPRFAEAWAGQLLSLPGPRGGNRGDCSCHIYGDGGPRCYTEPRAPIFFLAGDIGDACLSLLRRVCELKDKRLVNCNHKTGVRAQLSGRHTEGHLGQQAAVMDGAGDSMASGRGEQSWAQAGTEEAIRAEGPELPLFGKEQSERGANGPAAANRY
ncbi:hypothetical protein TREES_T100000914 [Tupaia chinensis]|uniref:Uncharacterized protein n=1 Tax=Tupaia chinensis TaxID=246437 RepID=L9JCB5_TUPCH|nr:hypothetical protein TREES_T100000914 [Tupaia chinensis]